jgi:cation-transporting ATPase 13A1
MITGDNPLTACHVARELRFMRNKTTLILTDLESAAAGRTHISPLPLQSRTGWAWVSVDETKQVPFAIEGKLNSKNEAWKELTQKHDLCLTGDGLLHLQKTSPKMFDSLLPHIKVFARVAPKQKELVITTMRRLGYYTLMCGDGTNDVGALKHSHTGVAILSNVPDRPGKEKKEAVAAAAAAAKKKEETNGSEAAEKLEKLSKSGKIAKRTAAPDSREPKLSKQQQQIQKMLKDLEDMDQSQVVKLGDASIAAPFTAKHSSIVCVNHIIKQGRCTLVTTQQMFKILALNALILAYSQSVLYLEGVKFSDGQATLQGLLLAACFLFISRSKVINE